MAKLKSVGAIAKEIAKREGKKSEVRIGDIREILSVLADLFHEDFVEPEVVPIDLILYNLGARRAKRKKKAV